MSEFRKSGGFGGGRGNGGFNKRDGGRPRFGGKPSFGRPGPREDRESRMFSTTCDECKKECEVPFRPTGDKPVYCSNCFGNKREGSSFENLSRDARGGRGSREVRDSRGGREERESRDFSPAPQPRPQVDDRKIDEIKRQIDTLSSKLDKLIETIGRNTSPAPVVQAKAEKKIEKVEKVVVAPKKEVKKVTTAPKKAAIKVVTKKKVVAKKK